MCKRYKILIRTDPVLLIGVFPLDWIAFVYGASNEVPL